MVLGNGGLLMLFVGVGEEKTPKIQQEGTLITNNTDKRRRGASGSCCLAAPRTNLNKDREKRLDLTGENEAGGEDVHVAI
jgi:hypothetical protein